MTQKSVIVRRKALEDLDKIQSFIAIDRGAPGSAEKLITELARIFELIAENPKMGTLVFDENVEFMSIRSFTPGKFPNYIVYYDDSYKGVDILRILHARQDRSTPQRLLA